MTDTNKTEQEPRSGLSDLTVKLGCPYCGNDEYYRKGRFSGYYEYKYRFDGGETDNSGLHDGADYQENRTMFCSECHKKVGVAQPNVELRGDASAASLLNDGLGNERMI